MNLERNKKTANVITRQLTTTAVELDRFDKTTPLTTKRYKFKRNEIGSVMDAIDHAHHSIQFMFIHATNVENYSNKIDI